MKIVGCDLHTRYQQVAMLDAETGELMERRLEHESGEARAFYAGLAGPVRVGIEAIGHTHWFERMLAELGHEPGAPYIAYFAMCGFRCSRKVSRLQATPLTATLTILSKGYYRTRRVPWRVAQPSASQSILRVPRPSFAWAGVSSSGLPGRTKLTYLTVTPLSVRF